MATKTRGRRRKSASSPPLGKESWQIVDMDGNVLRELANGQGSPLLVAQRLADMEYSDPTELQVRLKPLFGEPDVFWRVVRDEDGIVWTFTVQPGA